GSTRRVLNSGHQDAKIAPTVTVEPWPRRLTEEDDDWTSSSTTRTGDRAVDQPRWEQPPAQPTERSPTFSCGRSLVYLGSLLGLLCAIGGIAAATFLLAGAGNGEGLQSIALF
ncbi:unnamed protein product, partial [Ixodes hexagonus]